MPAVLSDELIARIKRRLEDDWRRTGEGDWQRTPPALRVGSTAETMVGRLLQSIIPAQAAPPPTEPLKPLRPLGEKDVVKVEKALGFRLPDDLRRLYLELADGNFGPYFGIRRLSNWAADYLKLRANLREERGYSWPEALLPLVFLNGRRVCLDRHSGEIIFWDRPPKRCSVRKWEASFVRHAASLGEWLDRWIDLPTSCEGGLPGGIEALEEAPEWAGLGEVAKPDRVVKPKRTSVASAIPPLNEQLLQRVAERAADPWRRTSLAGVMAGSEPLDIDKLTREVEESSGLDDAAKARLGSIARWADRLANALGDGQLRVFDGGGPGFMMGFAGAEGTLGRPAGPATFRKAEDSLGFALPAPLRQLYELADGGFGPGDAGLLSLTRMAALYRQNVASPQGPNDEPWPARLLPLVESDPAIICLDVGDGSIVLHDVQDMEHFGTGQWERSFKKVADSLSAWLEHWLETPTLEEGAAWAMRDAHKAWAAQPLSPVTGTPMELDDPRQQAEAEIVFLEHACPSLRADFGLPETGWREEVRRRHGLAG